MRRDRIHIPKPRSNFVTVQCSNCGTEQVVYTATTIDIPCKTCQAILAQKTGGKARILGVQVRRLD